MFGNTSSSVWKVLKKAIAELNICWENFHGIVIHQKIPKTAKLLSFTVIIANLKIIFRLNIGPETSILLLEWPDLQLGKCPTY